MFSRILVGVDGSSPSQRAFAVALDLAKHYRAPLHVCSVIEDVPKYDGESIADVDATVDRARKALDRVYESLAADAKREKVRLVRHVVPGHPVEGIVQLAEKEGIECIVLGGLGHSRVLRRAAGGTGTQVAYHAHCSVLIVR